MNKNTLIRVSALSHGETMVKVIFHPFLGNVKDDIGYWMKKETYHSIPIMENATPGDFKKFGLVTKAKNKNIYDSEGRTK